MGISQFPAAKISGGYNWEVIGSIANMGTGTPASVSFTGIDPKYRALKLVIFNTTSSASRDIRLRLNNSSSGNYSYGVRNIASTTWSTDFDSAASAIRLNSPSSTNAFNFEVLIFDTNLAAPKTIASTGSATVYTEAWGVFNDTTVISQVNILHNSAQTFAGGVAYLLGSE